MFDFIPDMPVEFLFEKHRNYILTSLTKILSRRTAIPKYEDKRMMFLYCLIHASKYLGILEEVEEKFKDIVEKHIFENFYTSRELPMNQNEKNQNMRIGYFVSTREYKNIEVREFDLLLINHLFKLILNGYYDADKPKLWLN